MLSDSDDGAVEDTVSLSTRATPFKFEFEFDCDISVVK
jgi:hypothetical protein